jgi:hypothetical protein
MCCICMLVFRLQCNFYNSCQYNVRLEMSTPFFMLVVKGSRSIYYILDVVDTISSSSSIHLRLPFRALSVLLTVSMLW